MTSTATEPGNGLCQVCYRDLFRHGFGENIYCEACLRSMREHPGRDIATMPNGRSERILQERPSLEPGWDSEAACAGAPGELFDHRTLPNESIPSEIGMAAIVYCAYCPVLEQCRREADSHEFVGLWGGVWRSYAQRSGAKKRFLYTTVDLTGSLDTSAA